MFSYTSPNKRISHSNNDQKLLDPVQTNKQFSDSYLRRKTAFVPPLPFGITLLVPTVLPLLWNWEPTITYSSGSRLATSSFWPFCQDELRICSSGQSNFLGGVYLVVEVEIKHRWFPIFCLEDTRESFATKNLIQDFLVFHRSSQVRLWQNRRLN